MALGYSNDSRAINIDENNPYICAKNNVIYSKDMSKLISHTKLDSGEFKVPDTVTEISTYAFKNSNLSSIILPDNLKNIDDYAFNFCQFISELKIPESLII